MISYLNNDIFYFVCEQFDENNNLKHSLLCECNHSDYCFAQAFNIANYEAKLAYGNQQIKIISHNKVLFNWKVRPITKVEYLKIKNI